MSPNLNTSISMAPPPIETPVHINLSQPLHLFSLLQEPSTITKTTEENFEFDTKEDFNDMEICEFTKDTSPTPPTPLIWKEFEKTFGAVWEVFPELLDNPRESGTIPPIDPSTPHTSISSTIHYNIPSITPTTIFHIHHLPISGTNITTSINTPELVKTSLQTIPTTISTTTTNYLGSVTLPKQLPSEKKTSIEELAYITMPKALSPTLDLYPSRDFRLKRHKKKKKKVSRSRNTRPS